MKFIDLHGQFDRLEANIRDRLNVVLSHQEFINGPEVRSLEERLSAYVGVPNCVSCANGTDALQIVFMALGVGQGDEIITPAFTYIATSEAAAVLGAVPVYVDCEADTFLMDAAALEAVITPRTKAIVAVSLYGQIADMDAINAIAQRHGVVVVEDAAQSFGAKYEGRRSCGLSRIATTSFFPTKPLGCYGDGGAIFTDDADLALIMRQTARHGQDRKYHHVRVGMNSRLDTLQAAVLHAKLDVFDAELELREEVARRYSNALADLPGLRVPVVREGRRSAWAQYTVRVPDGRRDPVAAALKQAGVPSVIYYPLPLHRQPAVANRNSVMPNSDLAADEVLSLPMNPYLTENEQDRVVGAIKAAMKR